MKTGTEKEDLTQKNHLFVHNEDAAQWSPLPQKKGRKVAVPSLGLREMQGSQPWLAMSFPLNISLRALLNSLGQRRICHPGLLSLKVSQGCRGVTRVGMKLQPRLECSLVGSPNLPSWLALVTGHLATRQDQSPGLRTCTLPHGMTRTFPEKIQGDLPLTGTDQNYCSGNKFWHLNLIDLGGCLQFTRLTVLVFKYFNSCWPTNFWTT